ncbi:MAG: 50S ribosomal protein L30, partial [Desulfatiglandales bacterium]
VKKVRETVRSLGLRKLHQTVTVKNNKAMRGMLKKVSHLVKIEV